MPVVQRQILPYRPSGLERFVQSLGGLANVATSVGGLIALPKRLRREQERLDLAGQQVEVSKGQLAVQEATQERLQQQQQFTQDTGTLNRLIGLTIQSRDALLDRSGNVDPALRAAAVTLGDVPPEYRQKVRSLIVSTMGLDDATLTDDFLLSGQNLEGVLDQEIMRHELGALSTLNPNEASAFGRAALTERALGEPTELSALVRERFQNAFINNEMFRRDETGKIVGFAASDPTTVRRQAYEALGLESFTGYDVTDPTTGVQHRIQIPSDLSDQIFLAQIQSMLGTEAHATNAMNTAAVRLGDELAVPVGVAHAILAGNVEGVPEELQPLIQVYAESRQAAFQSISNLTGIKGLLEVVEWGRSMDLEGSDLREFVESTAKGLQTVRPDIIIPVSKAGFDAIFSLGPNLTIPESEFPGAAQRDPALQEGTTQGTLEQALNETIPSVISWLQGLPPAAREAELQNLEGQPDRVNPDTGARLRFDAETISILRGMLEETDTLQQPNVGGSRAGALNVGGML